MKQPISKRIIVNGIWLLLLVMAAACKDETNPYAQKARQDSANADDDDNVEKASDEQKEAPSPGATPEPGSPAPTGKSTPPTVAVADAFHAACKKLEALPAATKYATDLKHLCADGKATALSLAILGNAYDGTEKTGKFDPVLLKSTGKQTELIMPASIKFPLTIKQIGLKKEASLTLKVAAGGVTVTNSIMQTIPAIDDVNLECYITKQNISTKVAFFNINDDIVNKECHHILSKENPLANFTGRTLVEGDPANTDNPINVQVNILVQIDDKTSYSISIYHIITDNKGFADQAEGKMKAQPAAFMQEYFKTLVGK